MEQFKITAKTQLANGKRIIVYAMATIVGFYSAIYSTSNNDNKIFILVFGFAFLFQLLPQLALHLNYYFLNRGDLFTYDALYKDFHFTHNNEEVKFNADDIEVVNFYKSFALNRKDIELLAWDTYNHVVIELKNKTRITISSLMVGGEIRIPVNENKVRLKLNLYRWAFGPSLKLP